MFWLGLAIGLVVGASFGAVIAYGVIVYSLSYRYLPLFPQAKREVKHVSRH